MGFLGYLMEILDILLIDMYMYMHVHVGMGAVMINTNVPTATIATHTTDM